MKQFKWKGIPVNIPDKKIEWQLLGGLIFFQLLEPFLEYIRKIFLHRLNQLQDKHLYLP